jgi:tripartite-type tricarboxylate transporter receptor subunit TctC
MQPIAASFRLLVALLAAALGFAAGPASAQTYPTQPIKIIVATAAGGIADLVARTLAQKLSEGGKTTLVENRTGGAGAIGADAAAKAPPDGYTLFIGMHSTNAILHHLVAKLPYDGIKDFAPVTNIVASANSLVVHPDVPAKSMSELVAYAKSKPGKLIYASQGKAVGGDRGGGIRPRLCRAASRPASYRVRSHDVNSPIEDFDSLLDAYRGELVARGGPIAAPIEA